MSGENEMSEWVNVTTGADLTGYTASHVRWLARNERIRAIKVNSRAWLVHREDLIEHKETVEPGRPKESEA